MTARRVAYIGLGKVRTFGEGLYPSEPGYVASINAQMRQITDNLLAIFKQFEDATPEIMLEALEPTAEKSDYYCPKDTLALVQSRYLEVTEYRGNSRVELGYAKGGEPWYGVYTHEMIDYKHQPPTRSKFLQAAMMEDLDAIYVRLGVGYKAMMDGLQ